MLREEEEGLSVLWVQIILHPFFIFHPSDYRLHQQLSVLWVSNYLFSFLILEYHLHQQLSVMWVCIVSYLLSPFVSATLNILIIIIVPLITACLKWKKRFLAAGFAIFWRRRSDQTFSESSNITKTENICTCWIFVKTKDLSKIFVKNVP